MEESILITIKKMLGLDEDYEAFDVDIIVCINSAIMALTQLGIGPEKGFRIEDDSSTWSEFIGDFEDLEAVKLYVYIKTRLVFDPPTSSAVIDALKSQASEYEFRISLMEKR